MCLPPVPQRLLEAIKQLPEGLASLAQAQKLVCVAGAAGAGAPAASTTSAPRGGRLKSGQAPGSSSWRQELVVDLSAAAAARRNWLVGLHWLASIAKATGGCLDAWPAVELALVACSPPLYTTMHKQAT